MASKSDLIRRFFAAYKARDRKMVEDGMAEGFTFTSPYDDAIDKAAYFERCWPKSIEVIEWNRIEKIFEQDDEAFVLYLCRLKSGEQFRNTEFFVFEGDKIKSINVYFGATYEDG